MKKQIKTLVAAGLITIVSAGSIVTSHADSKTNTCKTSVPKIQLICINSQGKPEVKSVTNSSFSAYQQEVLNLVNQERAKVGAKPLTLNNELSNVATKKSQDMIDKNYFDHTSPTYGSPFDMMRSFRISYQTAGENIAMGQQNPAEVMNAWMNSDGHRRNILNPEYTKLGVGIAKASNGQLYWTQMFIGK